jgi:hypothetical protein
VVFNWRRSGLNGWRHKERNALRVFIRLNANKERPEKYQVFHSHPRPDGGVTPQDFQYAWNMRDAKKKARVHLRHWNDPKKWRRFW